MATEEPDPQGLQEYIPRDDPSPVQQSTQRTPPGRQSGRPPVSFHEAEITKTEVLASDAGDGEKSVDRALVPFWFSSRVGLAIMCFLGVAMNYSIRVNLSVAIVCMVNQTALRLDSEGLGQILNSTESVSTSRDEVECDLYEEENEESLAEQDLNPLGGTILWDKTTQGVILGAFFWGYVVGQVPAGWLAIRLGAKSVFAVSMQVASLATILTPFVADKHYYVLSCLRVILGLASSSAFASVSTIWGNWSPPEERTKMITCSFAGAQVGIMLTFPLSGLMCQQTIGGSPGWPMIFYVSGGLTFLWSLAWILLVSETPWDHKRISYEEKEYIMFSLGITVQSQNTKLKVPWLKLLTSMPVWSVIVGMVCFDWGSNTLLINMPTYLNEVFHFDIASNGLLSALPYLGYWIVCSLGGWVADCIMSRGLLSVLATRKVFDFIGKLLSASILIGLGLMDCTMRDMAVILLILAVSTSAIQISGFSVNNLDIAPSYAGIIMSFANTLSGITGIGSAYIVGFATQENQTRSEWQLVFNIAAIVYVLGALFFLVFAKGEEQEWARRPRVPQPTAVEVEVVEEDGQRSYSVSSAAVRSTTV